MNIETEVLVNMTEDQYERHLDMVENTIKAKHEEETGCHCGAVLDGRDCMCFEGAENFCFVCEHDTCRCTCKKCAECGNEAKYNCRC